MDTKMAAEKGSEAARKAAGGVQRARATLQEAGYFDALADFNQELIRPLQQAQTLSLKEASQEILRTLKLQPTEPNSGFSLWNVLGFYLSVIEASVGIGLGGGGLAVLTGVASAAVAYTVAYTLHWGILAKKSKAHCLLALVLLAAYGAYCCFSVFFSIFRLHAIVLFSLKAFAVAMMLVNGVKIYNTLASSGGPSLI